MKITENYTTTKFESSSSQYGFAISITQESDFSQDGGHTFETIENEFALNKMQALALIDELTAFYKE